MQVRPAEPTDDGPDASEIQAIEAAAAANAVPPEQVWGPLDPTAEGYATLEALEADFRLAFDVPDHVGLRFGTVVEDGGRRTRVALVPPGTGAAQAL